MQPKEGHMQTRTKKTHKKMSIRLKELIE